ncbi:hypothetical protein [Pontibaca salina]|uniref:Uncharacterized protein n=1 Tax=Pontibaca salina TaxID=2795731 RepID=A0A934HUY0_9RHOB|nr:hypothetical protein [Pontibaca salina]MBI6630009.1 hypothetical protein [Pontibaca salina]
MNNVKGLRNIKQKTEEMSKFVGAMNFELAKLDFDATDPASIKRALKKVNKIADEKTSSYKRNDWIQNFSRKLKGHVRKSLTKRAAETHIGG